MEPDYIQMFEASLLGRTCSIQRLEFGWYAIFGDRNAIVLGSPWRIISEGRIALTDKEDGQQFGLRSPLDGQAVANELLAGKSVTAVSVNEETADIVLDFGPGLRLEVFNFSASFEGWNAEFWSGDRWTWIIALGGGELSIFSMDQRDAPG